MFVYVWKHNEIPFYVGMTKSIGRTNPLNSGGRGWLCKQKLEQVGRANVVVEIHTTETLEAAQALEVSLIEKYGRVQLGTGPLTNLKAGGDGWQGMSPEAKAKLSLRMKEKNPVHDPEVRAKISARINSEENKAKFLGENNPAKRPEVREKLREKWQDPEYRAARVAEKIGRKIHSAESKELRRQKLLDPSNPMRETHKLLNTDLTIREKRNASNRTPEARAKKSEAMKKIWEKRRMSKI